jgi:hypothetical protein
VTCVAAAAALSVLLGCSLGEVAACISRITCPVKASGCAHPMAFQVRVPKQRQRAVVPGASAMVKRKKELPVGEAGIAVVLGALASMGSFCEWRRKNARKTYAWQ